MNESRELNRLDIDKDIFKDFPIKKWPGNKQECKACLTQLRYSDNVDDFLLDSGISSELQKDLSGWNLNEIMGAAIYYEYQNHLLDFTSWTLFISILLNPAVTDSFFSFLKQNQFHEIEQKKTVIYGAKNLFKHNYVLLNKKSLKNFFDFLRIDESTSNILISNTFLKENFMDILLFLEKEEDILLTFYGKQKRKTEILKQNLEHFLLKNGNQYFWLYFLLLILLGFLATIFFPRTDLKHRKRLFEPGPAPFAYMTDSWKPQSYQKTDTVSEITASENTGSKISFSSELANASSNNKTDSINENNITNTKSLPVYELAVGDRTFLVKASLTKTNNTTSPGLNSATFFTRIRRPVRVQINKPIVCSLKKTSNPSAKVHSYAMSNATLRTCLSEAARQSQGTGEITIVTAYRVDDVGETYAGLELVSLNGIEDQTGVLARNDALYYPGHTFPNNKIRIVPDPGLSRSDKKFVKNLEEAHRCVHYLITADTLAIVNKTGNIDKISSLKSPVILRLDSGKPLAVLLQNDPDSVPTGFVTNINRKTKTLETYGSVVYFHLAKTDMVQIEKRIKLMTELHPEVKRIVTGVSKVEFDHFDGAHFPEAFGTKYSRGVVVAVPDHIHDYFTRLINNFQEGYLLNIGTIEARISYKHSLNLRIIEQISETEFKNCCITKNELRASYTLAANKSRDVATTEYQGRGFTSREYLYRGRARHAVYKLLPSINAFTEKLEMFNDYPQKGLDLQKVAITGAKLFNAIEEHSRYAQNIKFRLRTDANSNQPIAVERWVDQAFDKLDIEAESLFRSMVKSKFNLANPMSHFPKKPKVAILPSIEPTEFLANLKKPATQLTEWGKLTEAGCYIGTDFLEGKLTSYFNPTTNLSLYKL